MLFFFLPLLLFLSFSNFVGLIQKEQSMNYANSSSQSTAKEISKASPVPPSELLAKDNPRGLKKKRNIEKGLCGLDVENVNKKLIELKFLPKEFNSDSKDCFDDNSYHALNAFQKYFQLTVDGVVGKETRKKLNNSQTVSLKEIPGWQEINKEPTWSDEKIIISLQRQILIFTKNNKIKHLVSASSGKTGFTTPPGAFSVFRKEENSWSVPYETWMPWALYFNQGIATHESADVPNYPASHGCVRLPKNWAKMIYNLSDFGTTVIVLA